MTTWYPLAEADASFLHSAPIVHRSSAHLAATPEQAWAALASQKALGQWVRGVRIEWTSPRPYGVGTTRIARLGPLLSVRERFFAWQEGQHHSFAGTAVSRPGLLRLAEDYAIEPDGDGSRFTWTFAIEPAPRLAPAVRLANPLIGLVCKGLPLSARLHYR